MKIVVGEKPGFICCEVWLFRFLSSPCFTLLRPRVSCILVFVWFTYIICPSYTCIYIGCVSLIFENTRTLHSMALLALARPRCCPLEIDCSGRTGISFYSHKLGVWGGWKHEGENTPPG